MPGAHAQKNKVSDKLLWFLITGGVCLFALSLLAWHLRGKSYQRWLLAGNNQLEPFSTVLVDHQSQSSRLIPAKQIDEALMKSMEKDRQVTHLSRSPYWYSLSKRQAWGKIHLETDTATTTGISLKINLLVQLKQKQGQWEVINQETLMIP